MGQGVSHGYLHLEVQLDREILIETTSTRGEDFKSRNSIRSQNSIENAFERARHVSFFLLCSVWNEPQDVIPEEKRLQADFAANARLSIGRKTCTALVRFLSTTVGMRIFVGNNRRCELFLSTAGHAVLSLFSCQMGRGSLPLAIA